MSRTRCAACLLLSTGILTALTGSAPAQSRFQVVTGKAFDEAVPKDFYLEGNAIPTEKRNAALVTTPGGARALFGLIDTTGYSSQIKKKYIGMLIAEGSVSVCGQSVGVGSYGFGLDKPEGATNEDGTFFLYNQAGEKLLGCPARKDLEIQQPRPLQVIPREDGTARLYLGRYWVELR